MRISCSRAACSKLRRATAAAMPRLQLHERRIVAAIEKRTGTGELGEVFAPRRRADARREAAVDFAAQAQRPVDDRKQRAVARKSARLSGSGNRAA